MDSSDSCPVCNCYYELICKCPLAHKICPNGHDWFFCPVHGKKVTRKPDHSKGLSECQCIANTPKKRKLVDGSMVLEAPESIAMTIDSKCPAKWLFVDLETLDVWEYKPKDPLKWRGATITQLKALRELVSIVINERELEELEKEHK